MEENMVRRKEYYFSNRDLLVIAILSGIGGVMSTYVGYLGNLVNRLFGVPYGAGQFVSGLHVFWFTLVALLVLGICLAAKEIKDRVTGRLPWNKSSGIAA
jgi:amino acid permease